MSCVVDTTHPYKQKDTEIRLLLLDSDMLLRDILLHLDPTDTTVTRIQNLRNKLQKKLWG